MWIYRRRKLCRKLRLLVWTSFIGQLVYPVREKRMGQRGFNGGIVILASCENHFITDIVFSSYYYCITVLLHYEELVACYCCATYEIYLFSKF